MSLPCALTALTRPEYYYENTEQTSCSLEARSIYQVSFHNCNAHTHTAIILSTWQLQIEHWNSESPGEWMSTSCCPVSISTFGDPFNSFLAKYLILCYTTGYKWYSYQLKRLTLVWSNDPPAAIWMLEKTSDSWAPSQISQIRISCILKSEKHCIIS